MKLLVRRDQKSAMLTGKTKFFLHVRAEITTEENQIIRKCGLGQELLVHHEKKPDAETITGTIIKIMSDTVLTTDKLIKGTEFNCKNVAELVEIEAQVKQAGINLKRYIEIAKSFGGEETLDIDELEKIAD